LLRAAHLAREALALWGAQGLADAANRYEEAIGLRVREHYDLLYIISACAFCAALGRDFRARVNSRKPLELEQGKGVMIAGASVAWLVTFWPSSM